MGKIQDGQHICQQTGTKFRLAQLDYLENIPDKFWKKSGEWSWRRCDNKIIKMLSKREVETSKMAIGQLY